jgi:hypothetical protein
MTGMIDRAFLYVAYVRQRIANAEFVWKRLTSDIQPKLTQEAAKKSWFRFLTPSGVFLSVKLKGRQKVVGMRPRMNPSLNPTFYELDADKFQYLCCDVFARQSGIATCDVYGTRGQKQRGIDLLARRIGGDGIEVGQCKCYTDFPPAKIRQASDEFFKHLEYWRQQNVRRFTLFVACGG